MRPVSLLPGLASLHALARGAALAGVSAAALAAVPALAEPTAGPAVPATAPANATVPVTGAVTAPPRLIVAISVDQFSADLFAQYRERFSAGLDRLQQGAVFASGFQSHAATETCPGHSTLLTGARPNRTGIIANSWFVPGIARADKEVYCSEDETNPASNSQDSVIDPMHLKVPTLGDLLKKRDPATLNVAVSAKDRAVVMMGGHTTDAAYWYKGKGFITYPGRQLSPAAVAQNAALAKQVEAGAPAFTPPGWCGDVDRALPMGGFTIGTWRFPLKPGDFKSFNRSPRMDAATADLAIRLLDELPLGRDAVPDVFSVSFSATDYVGHTYGNQGVEMCIQMQELDTAIGRLLGALDARGLDYVVVLSADHGGPDAPERMRVQGVPDAARIDPALTSQFLAKAVSAETGVVPQNGPLLYGGGSSGDIWLAAGLTKKQQAKVTKALVARLKANPQVAAVFTREDLEGVKVPSGNPQDWSMIERVAASYDPERSGQVLMMTRRAVVPGTEPTPSYTATHGSPWDYDRRVPMLFWRKGLARMEQAQPVETVDIAPTLASLVGLEQPAGTWDGRCLDIFAGEADTCPR